MLELITLTVFGTLISVLGIVNMTGNISSLHEYHRHRVTEEDRKPFGRLVGMGLFVYRYTGYGSGNNYVLYGLQTHCFYRCQCRFVNIA